MWQVPLATGSEAQDGVGRGGGPPRRHPGPAQFANAALSVWTLYLQIGIYAYAKQKMSYGQS